MDIVAALVQISSESQFTGVCRTRLLSTSSFRILVGTFSALETSRDALYK